jgi:hypothetical protein
MIPVICLLVGCVVGYVGGRHDSFSEVSVAEFKRVSLRGPTTTSGTTYVGVHNGRAYLHDWTGFPWALVGLPGLRRVYYCDLDKFDDDVQAKARSGHDITKLFR